MPNRRSPTSSFSNLTRTPIFSGGLNIYSIRKSTLAGNLPDQVKIDKNLV